MWPRNKDESAEASPPSQPSPIEGEGGSPRRRFLDGIQILSLAEQGIISGSNFLALMLLARGLPAEQFGLYSFAYVALQFLVNLHRAVVVVPFVIHTAHAQGLAAQGASWRRLNGAATAVAVLGLAVVGGVVAPLGGPAWMGKAFLAAAAFAAANFHYEFWRRWAIQLGRYGVVLAGAMVYGLIICAGFLAAKRMGSLPVALLSYVLANLAAGLLFLPVVLRTPTEPAHSLKQFVGGRGGFLGWSLLSNLAYNGYFYLPPLILGGVGGPAPLAAYQALRNFIQPLNLIGSAVDNFDKPRAARALAAEGLAGLRARLRRTTGAMTMLTLPWALLLAVFSKPALAAAYGQRYLDYGAMLHQWIAVFALLLLAYPVETALMLMRRPDLLFRGRLLAAILAIAVCTASVPARGAEGALFGLLAGGAASILFGIYYLRKAAADRRAL